MKKYSIEVSEEQMKLIGNALEDICRFANGQMRLETAIWDILDNQNLDFDTKIKIRNQAEEKLEELRKILFPDTPHNASGGYNKTPFIGNLYQIYKTIYYRLAIDNNWNNVHSYPPLPSGTMGTITIKKLEQ